MSTADEYTPEASETFFRNLLEMAPDAMIIIDRGGRIVVVNSQVEQLFGYLREELYGQSIEMLLPERFRANHASYRSGYAANPHVRPMGKNMALAGLRRDGREFPVEISLSPVKTQSGNYVSSVIRDVTERKRMEAEIIEARRIAERANKANTAFLAAASHDLRQPVQALSLLNGALRRTVNNPSALEMIDSQQQSLDAMTNLLNSLLDISRLDGGAVEPRIEVFPIQALFDRLSAGFSRQASQKGLNFEAKPSAIMAESDPHLLGEIIQNFVSNAIRYTKAGKVELVCDASDGQLCITVSDTGIGIEAQNIGQIFTEFHQIRLPGQKSEGFGLGLAIVKRMSDLLGHRIEVKSEFGKGSAFSIFLPAAAPGHHALPVDSRNAVAGTGPRKSGTIILIEDDTAVANALVALMEAEGYQVAVAGSAREATALVKHIPVKPDLLISDFHLRDGSTGVEAVSGLRAFYDDLLPAFIVTGDTSIVIDAVKSLPNSLLIRKPVNPDNLLRDAAIAIESGEVPGVAHTASPYQ